LRDGRRRCARCRLDWRPGRLPLRLSRGEWRTLLTWFARGAPSADIARETGLERKRVLRALSVVRQAMLRAAPGGRRTGPADLPGRSPGSRRASAVIGIYAVAGDVGADLLTPEDIHDIGRMLSHGTADEPVPPALQDYVAVVIRGRLHRLPRPGSMREPFGQIEAFWAYLQRHLRTRGGIRTSRLNLYLAEYSWRYRHRRATSAEQVQRLLKLVGTAGRWSEWDYAPRGAAAAPGFYWESGPVKH
jgi:hypothetical protein